VSSHNLFVSTAILFYCFSGVPPAFDYNFPCSLYSYLLFYLAIEFLASWALGFGKLMLQIGAYKYIVFTSANYGLGLPNGFVCRAVFSNILARKEAAAVVTAGRLIGRSGPDDGIAVICTASF